MDENAIEQLSRRVLQRLYDTSEWDKEHLYMRWKWSEMQESIASELRSALAEAPAPDLDAIEALLPCNGDKECVLLEACVSEMFVHSRKCPAFYREGVSRRLRAGPPVGLVDGVKVIGSVNKNGTDLLVVLCPHCECPRFADYSCDTCAKREPPTAGSWQWALEQMKAGKPVKRQRWPEGSSLVLHPYELEAGRFLILLNVLGRHPWQSVVEDFEATDWQLAESEEQAK